MASGGGLILTARGQEGGNREGLVRLFMPLRWRGKEPAII